MSVAAPQSPSSVHQPYPGLREFNPVCCAQPRPSARRLRHVNVNETERNWAVAMHLAPLAMLIFWPLMFATLIIWLVRKDHSTFDDDHGREVVNFGLSFFLLHIILMITIVGVLLIPVLWIVALVNMIRGAVAAGNGEYFRYPMTFRFF